MFWVRQQNIQYWVNDAGGTQQIKSTIGIAATDINDATNANNSMDTTIGEITDSL